jgi:peptidoglycan/LPS O-acetylase OafA/YrhL
MNRQGSHAIPDLRGHIPALDGLRGAAILLVISYHSFILPEERFGLLARIAPVGWCGVDLFFVLSGFLITGILLDARGSSLYFRNFYIRRVLRIFPLYYAALALSWIVIKADPYSRFGTWPFTNQVFYWSYLQNWTNVFSNDGPSPPWLRHFWSLAVEEQFYLCWPLVVYCVGPKRLMGLCLGLFALALMLRYYLVVEQVPWETVDTLTVTRVDGLAVGAFLAAYLRCGYSVSPLIKYVTPALALGSLAILVIGLRDGGFILYKDRCWTLKFGHTAMAVFFGALLLAAVLRCGPTFVLPLCCNRGLRLVGKYSYFMYIVHWPVLLCITALLGQWGLLNPGGLPSHFVGFVVTLISSFALAAVSWHYFEEPILRLKRYFQMASSGRVSPVFQIVGGRQASYACAVPLGQVFETVPGTCGPAKPSD